MARRHVGVLERLAFNQMCQACGVVLSRVHLRVVIPDPASDLEEADPVRGRVLAILLRFFDLFKVGVVQFFPVQEPRLLEDAYSLKPVFFCCRSNC